MRNRKEDMELKETKEIPSASVDVEVSCESFEMKILSNNVLYDDQAP